MKVLIASGGTGGHFYPGLALARELKLRGGSALFILRAGDPAGPRLDAEGLPWAALELSGLPRRPSTAWLTAPVKTARALLTARDIVRAWRPDAVVGMGGYLTLPAALAGAWRGAPVVLHEANALLGLANRLSRPFSSALALGLPLEGGERGLLVGTPLRLELHARGDAGASRKALGLEAARPTVLVVGGSQGARALNRLVPAGLARAAAAVPGVQVVHLAGRTEADAVRAAYAAGGTRAIVLDYLERMDQAYAAADLAVCRAGATTIAELAAQRLPALLVPYPFATARHQDANARVLERAGAAELLDEESLSPERLAGRAAALLRDPSRRAAMADAYGRLGLPAPGESVRLFADLVERAAGKTL
ncbi:MAG: UDP-N-acetylglucosamine--N-acetylmuramyl-(pentapeptide) pyrophosphoryl-undecaprenol N-acetylglucosamine transferase [Elusimicrobia bacterium]|nr:UDP-N-acetylglucosamine--N-acetylmuramyl-(pentapeptide) pyrophosphoryl-undecaprenol N-acetylglucosamine transferase [Elusimicrobiota bacterium]